MRAVFLGLVLFGAGAAYGGVELPLVDGEAAVVRGLVAVEGIEVEVVEGKWSVRTAAQALVELGFAEEDFQAVTIADVANERRVLSVSYDRQGRVLALTGNGGWLRNEGLKLLPGLPELRVIRIDHNGPVPKSGVSDALYDGAGFAAMEGSKLAVVKIGAAFGDPGVEALAKVKTLKKVYFGHSKVSDAGVAALAGHPNLEEVAISPMGRKLVTDVSLPVLASIPKIKRIEMIETFVTYEEGLRHLKKLKGQLEMVDLKLTLVLPEDVEKLKADLPGVEVITSTVEEIGEKAFRKAQLLKWASPEAAALLTAGD